MNIPLDVSTLPPKIIDYPIFDSDTHWSEPADLWTSRAPAKFKDQVMHVRREPTGVEAWYLADERIVGVGPGVIKSDLSKQLASFTLPSFESMTRAGTYAEERVQLMDAMGVGSQILYPNAIGFGASTMRKIKDNEELARFHVTSYNDALVDMMRDSGNRIHGQMALPFWSIDACVAEMERCRKLGLIGVAMSAATAGWGQPTLAEPAWDRFWAAAQDLDLPINFHIAAGSFEEALAAPDYWGTESFFLDDNRLEFSGPRAAFQSTTLFMGNATTLVNLLVTGILDKFPRLKFVSVESGLSWVPFIIQAVAMNFNEVMSPEQRAQFKRSPREAFLDQIYLTYWFEDRDCVDFFLTTLGSDNLMYETDFPHPASVFPGVQAQAVASVGHLPEEIQRKILYKNAERVYGVEVGKISDRGSVKPI